MRTVEIILVVALLAGGCGPDATDDEAVRVCVAANFAVPQARLAERFSDETGHEVVAITGSTGQLYAQIANGSPVDVFLAADEERPERLEREGLVEPGRRFTYARGRLALFGPGTDVATSGMDVLRTGGFRYVAIANPELAPYGAAARELLSDEALWSALQDRIVFGENVAQTLQFVVSGGAELGFVALSQVLERDGAYWPVPEEAHAPIRQDAVLLLRGSERPAARAYFEFLRGPDAREIIARSGYSPGS